MAASIDILDASKPKRVVIVASNPAVSGETGWPIGFWWSELAHPHWELTGHGYEVVVASPDGGALQADSWSDPRDESGYSAEDLISLGFISSPAHASLVENSTPLADIRVEDFDAALFVGGQGPMYTFWNDERVHRLVASFYEAGKMTAVICHATCVLIKTRLSDGRLLVEGKTMDGLRQLRGAVRGRVRRQAHPAVPHRGRGQEGREHELHRPGQIQVTRGPRRQPDHRPAAVLRRGRSAADDRGARDLALSSRRLSTRATVRSVPHCGRDVSMVAAGGGMRRAPRVAEWGVKS